MYYLLAVLVFVAGVVDFAVFVSQKYRNFSEGLSDPFALTGLAMWWLVGLVIAAVPSYRRRGASQEPTKASPVEQEPGGIPFEYEGFEGHKLVLRPAGFWSGPKLFMDGVPVRKEKRQYILRDNYGKLVEARIKSNGFDPIPKIKIKGQLIELARSLKWYEYVWMGLPILLVVSGGALGALVGLAAVYSSARIFRSDKSALAKYGLSALVSVAAVVAFVVLVVVAEILIKGVAKG